MFNGGAVDEWAESDTLDNAFDVDFNAQDKLQLVQRMDFSYTFRKIQLNLVCLLVFFLFFPQLAPQWFACAADGQLCSKLNFSNDLVGGDAFLYEFD
jgi:hypothetical protein